MTELRFCNIRFNLLKPEHRKAWEHLQSIDRDKMKSYSNTVITALNVYFDKQNNEYTSDESLKRLFAMLKDKEKDNDTVLDNEIDWGFMGK